MSVTSENYSIEYIMEQLPYALSVLEAGEGTEVTADLKIWAGAVLDQAAKNNINVLYIG